MLKPVVIAISCLCASGASWAQNQKNMTIVVPFSAGTSTDAIAREISPALNRELGKTIIVENKVGAEGVIAGNYLINAKADGNTLLLTSSSLTVLDPLMKKTMPYDPAKEFRQICTIGNANNVMWATANKFRDLEEFLALAKKNPEKYTFAYSSASTMMAGELFQQVNGIKLRGIPYKSSTAGLNEVGAGEVDLMFIDSLSASALHSAKKIVPLVVSGEKPVSNLPELRTAAAAGIPNYKIIPWFGIYVSSKTPESTVAELTQSIKKALTSNEVHDILTKRALEQMVVCGAEFKKFEAEDIALWQQVIQQSNFEKR